MTSWTDDQKRVIAHRGNNLLVSASAGSGKTAVLVERVFDRIRSRETSVDEMLIVTFTRAAAAELRERIGARIESAARSAEDAEERAFFNRQRTLLLRAQITTIDGFCSSVVRNFSGESGIEAGSRVMEEAEAQLLQRDVLKTLLVKWHESADPEFSVRFASFAEGLSSGRNEERLMELIRKSYAAVVSNPYPEEFLAAQRSVFEKGSGGIWIGQLLDGARIETAGGLAVAEEACGMLEGMTDSVRESAIRYLELFRDLAELLGEKDPAVSDFDRYGAAVQRLADFQKKTPVFPRGKSAAEHAEVIRRLRSLLALCAQHFKTLDGDLFPYSEKMAERFGAIEAEHCLIMIDLTGEYLEAYRQAKAERGAVDFSDLEHGALRVLRNRGVRTEAAKEYARRFTEVMVDEYQDSNFLQEEILTAVSRMEDGEQNYFCVGDVKQSIYRFREARPELFLDKFRRYGLEEGGVRIDLRENFRSAEGILDFVNGLFPYLMRHEVGGIDYDDAASLREGRVVEPLRTAEDTIDPPVEILLAGCGGTSGEEDGSKEAGAALSEEEAIADRILTLVRNEQVCDDETQELRPIRYGDIVILLRSLTGAEELQRVLTDRGIPVWSVTRTGYFSTVEIQTVLAFLAVVDNPRQDIPFAASLQAAAGLSDDELARIRVFGNEHSEKTFFDCAVRYAECGPSEELREKTADFLKLFSSFRQRGRDLPLHELLRIILDETGYGLYLRALPGGAQRLANVRMLIERAVDFEQTSYTGLFQFNRYIDQIRQTADYGEAPAESENADVVRILTIHSSKGLQYPVVFLARLDRGLNPKDLSEPLLIHPELGYSMRVADPELHVRAETLKYRAMARRLRSEFVGEELRILYVAMTRAERKLILTASLSEKELEDAGKKTADLPDHGHPYPAGVVTALRKPLDLILPVLLRMEKADGPAVIRYADAAGPGEGVEPPAVPASAKSYGAGRISAENGEQYAELFAKRFSFVYPYAEGESVPQKLSVSELKHAAMKDEEAQNPYELPDVIPLVPDFRKEEEERLTGSDRGTAYHEFLAQIDFAEAGQHAEEDLRQYLETLRSALIERGILTEDAAEAVSLSAVADFIRSPVGGRLSRAQKDGGLWVEQPFTMQVPARSVNREWPEDETILVQGIIDAFFEEDGGLVLLDYKTDRVRTKGELLRRYRVQLDLYAEALTRALGLPVKEKLIYSFELGSCITVY